MWIFEQTGRLLHSDTFVIRGYSGFAEGKNNPLMQAAKNMGPIPVSLYSIGEPHDTELHGPYVLPLWPDISTETWGRSGFLIHGDSLEHPGLASHGCIIVPRNIRMMIHESKDRILQVVSGK